MYEVHFHEAIWEYDPKISEEEGGGPEQEVMCIAFEMDFPPYLGLEVIHNVSGHEFETGEIKYVAWYSNEKYFVCLPEDIWPHHASNRKGYSYDQLIKDYEKSGWRKM